MAFVNEDIVGGRGGFGFGGGEGGGILGLVALLALIGRNGGGGLLSGGSSGGVDGLNNLQGTIDTNAILGKLGTIEGSIPLSEAQVQLALAQLGQGIVSQINTTAVANAMGLSDIKFAQALSFAGLQKDIGDVDTNVDRQSCQIQNTIHSDGEATRALITTNLISQLQADKVILANEVTELRGDSHRERDRHGVEITMINNQNQNQLQFQQQSQVLANLHNAIFEVGQIARATNSNVIVGNTGATATGPQTANPTNVRA